MDIAIIITPIISAAFGWLLSNYQNILDWFKLRKEANWKGDWFCLWESDPAKKIWVLDGVELKRRFGTLFIRVKNAGDQYEWEIKGKLRTNLLLCTWKSMRPNSIAKGTITLKINPQGNQFYGYWIGPTESPKLRAGKVIVCKTEEEVNYIKNNFSKYI